MIKYICRNCNDLETETSICPVCGKRANLLSSEIYYCKKCNAPSFTEQCPECNSICEKIGSDMRPVFAKERLLLEVFLNKPMEFAGTPPCLMHSKGAEISATHCSTSS